LSRPLNQRREAVVKDHPLSMSKQCGLLCIHRSGLYYKPAGESKLNLELMHEIDKRFTKYPWEGSPRMTAYLRDDLGYKIGHKRIERLYRVMGLQTLGPRPNTSNPGKNHKIYPYLLKGLKAERANQGWAMDITFIPVRGGFLYLCAVIDLYSRYVLNWSLNNTMEAPWCKEVLAHAVELYGKPEIVNTDQGSQFTSDVFSQYVVNELEVRLSMDGKGRAIDNIFIERLWRSVKYEHVYLFPADDGVVCYEGLAKYFDYYNRDRRHSSIGRKKPVDVYQQSLNLAA
jgi:putative transposase